MAGNKKKKKKVRLTPEQQEQANLEKAAMALKHSVVEFQRYIDRLDKWLLARSGPIIRIFQTLDTERSGRVTHGQFKSGLLDMRIPCSAVELHLLCKLLDKDDSQLIEYNRVSQGLSHFREESHRQEDIRPSLRIQFKPFDRCPSCKMTNWNGEPYMEKYPRFINLTLRILTFESHRDHPAHVHSVVHSHLTVHHMAALIRQETGIATAHVAIFADRPTSPSTMVPLSGELSLEECGYAGGPQNSPMAVTLYYDFFVDFTACPLVMCDHYFGAQRKFSRLLEQSAQQRKQQQQRQLDEPLKQQSGTPLAAISEESTPS